MATSMLPGRTHPPLSALAALFASLALSTGLAADTNAPAKAAATGTNAAAKAVATNAPVTLKPAVVTGTYIASENAADTLSVDVIDVTAPVNSGYSTLQDTLRTKLTSFGGPGFVTPAFGNGGDGSSGIGLRGLPASATLLLVNGRRTSASDLNLIPEAAIERVEVLKDGAGAIYGSDAVAGVVNVILREDFKGVLTKAYYGFNDRDASINERKFSALVGDHTDKTRFLFSAEYSASDPLYSPDRPRSAEINPWQTSGTRNPGVFSNQRDYGYVTNGSGNVVPAALPLRWTLAPGVRVLNGAPPGFNPFGSVDTSGAADIGDAFAIRAAREAELNGLLPADSQIRYGNSPRFQYPLYTTLYRPHEAYGFNANVVHDLFGKQLQLFANTYYMHNESESQLAPSPVSGLSVTPQNYHFQQLFGTTFDPEDVLGFNYRTVEAGPRVVYTDFDTIHLVGGLRGQIAESTWNWEAGFLYDRVTLNEKQTGGIAYDRLNGLLADSSPGAWNPFGYTPPFGSSLANSAATVDSLKESANTRSIGETTGGDIRAGGEVFDLPAGPVSLSSGYANRRESVDYEPDYAIQQGLIGPYNIIQSLHKSRMINSVYAETLIPILGDTLTLPGFHEFSFSAAVRYEDYSDVGDTGLKPRFSFRWKPFEEEKFTLRGSYAQGFTAPGFFDLYQEPGEDFNELLNPVTGVLEQPIDGVLTVGNPNLKPTDTDTWLIGSEYSPAFLKGFTCGLDYYRIKQDGIPFASADYIVQQWYNYGPSNPRNPFGATATPSPVNPLGAQVELNPDGTLQQVRNVGPINTGTRFTDGLDFIVSQRLDVGLGNVILSGAATRTLNFEQEDFPGAGTINYLGQWWGDGSALPETGFPKWRANAGITYEYKRFTGTFAWNYVQGYDEPAGDWDARRVADYNTFDLRLSLRVPRIETDLMIGCNNLTDADPPLVKGSFENNFDRRIGDPRGRTFFVSLSKLF